MRVEGSLPESASTRLAFQAGRRQSARSNPISSWTPKAMAQASKEFEGPVNLFKAASAAAAAPGSTVKNP